MDESRQHVQWARSLARVARILVGIIYQYRKPTSQKQLAELAATWPAERLVEIWNSLPGVEPVKSFKSAQAAAGRIWNHKRPGRELN